MPRGMIAAPPFMPPMGMRFPGGMPGSMPVMPPLPGGMPQMPNAPQAQAQAQAPQQQPTQPQGYAQPYQPYAHPFTQPQVPVQPGYPAPYPDAFALQQVAAMQQIQAAQAALMPYMNQVSPEAPQSAEAVAGQEQAGGAVAESLAPVRTIPRRETYSTKGKGIHYSTRV